ncbi:MAG: hypothetical protein B9S26_01130 [Opitutia bacterium Tous-C4FEB]|nr:MAG: hypothetical protein B9S26_01130 [Opitutae bacterium Tous-C4FEB]
MWALKRWKRWLRSEALRSMESQAERRDAVLRARTKSKWLGCRGGGGVFEGLGDFGARAGRP